MTSSNCVDRPLTEREMAVLIAVLDLQHFSGRAQLHEQVPRAAVTGGSPLLLELAVVAEMAPADVETGPIPTRAVAHLPTGDLVGEVIVWTADGYLSGLEYAWYSDEMPSSFPPPEQLTVA